jgi:hypothetical protein
MESAQSPLNVGESERFRWARPEETVPDAPPNDGGEEVIGSTLLGGRSQREMKPSTGMAREQPVEEVPPAVQTKKTWYARYCEPSHN